MKKYKNPIIEYDGSCSTADPYVIRYNDMYYRCFEKNGAVYVSEAKELCDVGTGKVTEAYKDEPGFEHWYAPELHRIGDSWYIYGAPKVNEKDLHCMCVLELKGDSPMGRYENKGIIRGLENSWNIDGTILNHEGKNLFLWSDCGRIFMTEMDTPYSIMGKVLDFGRAEYEFEQRCRRVIEGPAVLKRGNKIHIIYSANDSKSDEYCLGRMTYSGGDIFDINNWIRHDRAVFEKTDKSFGPGHCSFTTVTENGKEVDYIVYHANLVSGSGWAGRHTWIQPFEWDEDDIPVFGEPNFGTEE